MHYNYETHGTETQKVKRKEGKAVMEMYDLKWERMMRGSARLPDNMETNIYPAYIGNVLIQFHAVMTELSF